MISLAYYYPTHYISQTIVNVVTSTHDFAFVQSFFQKEPIKLSVFQKGQQPIAQFSSISEAEDGYLLTYDEPFKITAHADGVVIYTGHTASNGKTLIVAYDQNVTATYHYVDVIFPLPYTTVYAGETIAEVSGGQLLLNVMQKNTRLNEQDLRSWLKDAP